MYHYPHNSAIISYWRCCYLYTTHATHLEDNYPDAEGTIAEVATTLSVLYGVLLLPVLVLYRSLELDASRPHVMDTFEEEEEEPPPKYEESRSWTGSGLENKRSWTLFEEVLRDSSLKEERIPPREFS